MRYASDDTRPLCEFPSGTTVTVTAIDGGAGARSRLCALGLTPGSRVVINGNGCGGCCVRVRDTTVTLGRGLAGKVLACPANGDAPGPDRIKGTCPCKERI